MGTMSHWRFAVDLAMDWGFPPDVLELSAQQKHAVEMWYDEFPFSSKYKGMRDDININYATFLSWKEKYEPKPPFIEKNGRRKQANIIPIEFTTYSKHFGYAGTVDLMCSIYDQKKDDDINIINDYKTNFVVYPSYQLQLSGYQIGVNELHPDIKIDGLYITNISPFEMNYSFTNQVFAKKKWLENVKKFFILNRESVEMKFLAEEVIKNIEDELG